MKTAANARQSDIDLGDTGEEMHASAGNYSQSAGASLVQVCERHCR